MVREGKNIKVGGIGDLYRYFYYIFSFIFGGAIDELNSQLNYVVRCGCGWCTDLLIIALLLD